MLRLFKTGFFWAGFLCLNFCYGQHSDIPLSALPMQYNSSFAGQADQLRFSSNYFLSRYRPRIDSYQSGFFASFDQFVPAIRSGIGFNAGYMYSSLHDRPPYPNIEVPSVYNIGLAIAPKFSIKGKVTISPSLDFNYNYHKSTNWEIREYQSRVGLLVNTAKGYIGFTANLYNEPEVDKVTDKSLLDYYLYDKNRYKFSFQIGYTLQISSESKFSVTPQLVIPINYYIHWNRQKEFIISKFILNFRFKKFLFGASDVGVHAGWQTDRLRIIGSYNMELLQKRRGEEIFNLSFRYTLKNNE